MEQITPLTAEDSSRQFPAPLTAAQVYEKLGALLRESPDAGQQPLYVNGNDFSFLVWEMEESLDSANQAIIWFGTDAPA